MKNEVVVNITVINFSIQEAPAPAPAPALPVPAWVGVLLLELILGLPGLVELLGIWLS